MKNKIFICTLCLFTGLANANEKMPPEALAPKLGDRVAVVKNEKIFPEANDPVLGDRAAIIEWAWSPAYAKRFGLPVQKDGLNDGNIWLLGVKILRVQSGSKDFQSYQCRIAGLIDNKAPIVWPPGERYVKHPASHWIGGMPGGPQRYTKDLKYKVKGYSEQKSFIPGQSAWIKKPANKREQEYPETGLTTSYVFFHRNYTADLAYFELKGGCAYFMDPASFRNELRFSTRIDGKNDKNPSDGAVFDASALTVDMPDSLMEKIYPYTLKAADWAWCLMRRAGVSKGHIVGYDRGKLERLGSPNCEIVNKSK